MKVLQFYMPRILGLLSAALLPLAALQLYTVYDDYERVRHDAFNTVLALSREKAEVVDEFFAHASSIVELLSREETSITSDVGACREALRGLDKVEPLVANGAVVDADGQVVCASRELAAPTFEDRNMRKYDWFGLVKASKGLVLTDIYKDAVGHRPVVTLAKAHHDAFGTYLGGVGVSIDLLKLGENLGEGSASVGHLKATVAIVRADSTLLTGYPHPENFIGIPVPAVAREMRAQAPEGVIIARTADGIERVVASTNLDHYGLRVTYALDADQVLGPARVLVRRSLTILALLVLATFGLAYWGTRWMRRPLDQLLAFIRAQDGVGQTEAPVPALHSSGEFGKVLDELNRLTQARNASENVLRLAYRKSERMAEFYSALSAANKAIFQARTPLELYEALCDICTKGPRVVLAWVGEVNEEGITAVATKGSAERYTHDLVVALEGDFSRAHSPAATAATSGSPCLVQDYATDERTAQVSDLARPYGIRASGAFPMRCQQHVVAVLNVYFREADVWEPELVRLLEELTQDISFALDNFLREANRRKAQAALRDQEQQLSRLIDTATDAILTVDGQFIVRRANQAAADAFGGTADALAGQPLKSLLPEWSSAHVPSGSTQVLDARKLDGSAFPAEAALSLSGPATRKLGLVILRDLSKAQEAHAARQARMKAEAANQAKTQFISRMSHELRTPLNAVLGFSQLLQSSASDRLTDAEKRQLDHIFLSGAQLRALIDDVLDVSRLEEGTLSMDLQDVDLQALASEVLSMCETDALKYSVKLELLPVTEPVCIRTDPLRVRQVLLNLVSNAIKYNRPDGQVSLELTLRPGKVDVMVRDTGMGMTALQLSHIFQPFNRLGRERSNIEGTGMGMAISRQLVELLGGSLHLDSTPGSGTVVTMTLPHIEVDDYVEGYDPRELVPATAGAQIEIGEPDEATILYIEDNPVNAVLVEQLLSRWPRVRCEVAVDGTQGLELAHELHPDLILLDMQLPDMTGLDVMERLRADATTRGLLVVALSASAMESDIAKARDAGASEYWTKPIDFGPFLSGVYRILANRND